MEFQLQKSELMEVVPTNLRSNITDEFIKDINDSISDPFHCKAVKDNAIGFISVLREGKYKLTDYINAVKYVSFKSAGYDNIDAYRETFPDRWLKFMQENTDRKTIHAYVSAYNKGMLVQRLLELVMMPIWLSNADKLQEAINVQAQLMNDPSVSPRDRTFAANSLMTHLKQPETNKATLNINVNNDQENDVLRDLREATVALREQQKSAMVSGVTIDQIAEAEIIKPVKEDEDV